MASLPWVRRISNGHSSSGNANGVVSPNSRNNSVISSDNNASDIGNGRANMADPKPVQKKRRVRSQKASTSDKTYVKVHRKPSESRIARNVKSKYGSFDERKRLVEAKVGSSSDLDYVLVNNPAEPNVSSRTRTTSPSTSTTTRFVSVFVLFLLPLVTGITIIVSGSVKSDMAAREIKPEVFHYYKISLISIFLLCCALQACKNMGSRSDINDKFEPLIPGHLLNGLALFGVCNCAFQTVEIIDFAKCSRSISGLDESDVVSAVFEMLFVFVQIYIFYTLSRRRTQKLWFGNYFTMFTLAINLTLWMGYFCAGVTSHSDLQDISWLQHWHYGFDSDVCAMNNNTGVNSRKFHEFVKKIKPYKFTFAMEYSLLASALLLHLWLEMATPSAGKFSAVNRKWEVWRVGFILGLLSLPLLGCVGVYSTVEYNSSKVAILYSFQFGILFFVLAGIAIGLVFFRKHYTRVKDPKIVKVDLILLCFSSLGFLVLDSFTIFACFAEMKNYKKPYHRDVITIGIASLAELFTIGILTTFIFASYFYKVRPSVDGVKASKIIRQIASFGTIVNIGFWMIRTYTFRSNYYFDFIGWKYFGTVTWFAITQFSTPLIIFYHFHCAVCLSGIIAEST